MNNKFTRTLDKWYVYFAWAVVAVFVWVWAVSAIVAPTEKETISVFVGWTDSVSGIKDVVSQSVSSDIRKVDVQNLPDENYLVTYYDAFGRNACDLCVLTAEQAQLIISTFGNNFCDLSSVDVAAPTYFESDGVSCGIELSQARFGDEKNDTYYVFLCRNSIHVGGFNEKSTDEIAIEVLKELVKR